MPVMDGYMATKKIRSLEDSDLANIPIIALSANAFEEDRKASTDAGMNGHLAKPVNVSELLKMLCKLLYQKFDFCKIFPEHIVRQIYFRGAAGHTVRVWYLLRPRNLHSAEHMKIIGQNSNGIRCVAIQCVIYRICRNQFHAVSQILGSGG